MDEEYKNFPKNVKIVKSFKPHLIKLGRYSGQYRNPYWHVIDNNMEEYYIMYSNNSKNYFKFDLNTIDKVMNVNGKIPSWYKGQNGYICCTYSENSKNKYITLHQHLTGHIGHGKGQESIDHNNRDKLDNRMGNLEKVTQSQQNKNRDKKKRNKNAQK